MGHGGDVLDRFRAHIYLNDVHPVDWFEDFDKLRSGRVSVDRFRRCFEFFKFRVTDAELHYLTTTFADQGELNYRAFCHTVLDIFTNQEFESLPTGDVKDGGQVVAVTSGRVLSELSPELHVLFVKLQHQIKFRGVHVRESYMDFDTHNNGRVSSSQFLRRMPFQYLSPRDIQLLLQRYMNPTVRDVNYWMLHQDLQQFSAAPPGEVPVAGLTMPHHLQSVKLNPLSSNPADVVQRFSAYVRRNRVRIFDFFVFHDRLKSGRITSDQFMNVLTLFGFQFCQDELVDLARRYAVVDGYTRYATYRDFCSDVDSAARAASNDDVTPDPRAQDAIDGVRSYVSRNRIHVLPPFQDFDRSHRGYVSELQFGRVLATMNIPVQRSDLPLLLGAYRRPSGTDYFRFVEDVDPSHGEQRRSYRPLGTTRQSIQEVYRHTPAGGDFVTQDTAGALIHESKRRLLPKLHEQGDADELLRDMQRWCYTHSVHFHDFLKEFDGLNSGDVSATQFRAGLLRAGYRLTENEHQALIDRYRSPCKEGFVQWKRFADDVLSFVAPRTLEQTPIASPLRPDELLTTTIQQRSQRATPTPEVQRILKVVSRFVIARRISLMQQFVDKDPHHHKQVAIGAFAQVIQLIGIYLTKPEIDLLSQFYIDLNTKFVRYPDFVADIQQLGGMDFGESSPTQLAVNPRAESALDISKLVPSCPKVTPDQIQWRVILPKIQSFVLKRRLRIVEFFENFDRLKHGTVTEHKFRSVVGQLDLPLSEDEIQFIVKMFALEAKPDLVNYRLFCQEVDEVFGVSDLHRTPSRDATCRAS